MRISDWSSDVCSSDLTNANAALDRIYRKPPSIHQRRCAHVKRGDFVAPFADHRRCYKQAYLTPEPFPAVTNSCQCHLLEVTVVGARSEEHTSELQSLMRISYAVFCLKKKTTRELHK